MSGGYCWSGGLHKVSKRLVHEASVELKTAKQLQLDPGLNLTSCHLLLLPRSKFAQVPFLGSEGGISSGGVVGPVQFGAAQYSVTLYTPGVATGWIITLN